ncbi:ATP-binding protein [Alkalihalobacillus sp. MEB130]|uniref:ATP-binding protein n=1 Tax=Alkalihalobacillus sp. MEB130 TaxID=2976704 RepID=UPI0028DF676D|nr:ATP-binding protein [Alkalihalobacillus sp. MEB130]MDT8860615.1 ATP-binding protein [Alkalihalobacillus sp. MEB130]
MSSKEFDFTSHLRLSSGCHVLYSYSHIDAYVKNAVSFISEGMDKDHFVVFIDSKNHLEQITPIVESKYGFNSISEQVLFVDSEQYYQFQNGHQQIVINFRQMIKPHLPPTKPTRIWGFNQIDAPYTMLENLKAHEQTCQCFIEKHHSLMVCAYDGQKISAAFLGEMLHYHEYYMTDTSLVPSNLYYRSQKKVMFPSISEQVKREKDTEDFMIRSEKLSMAGQLAAGIAHEIRNPLTSIKGFFQLIKESNDKEHYYNIIEEELTKIEQVSSEMLLLAKPHSEVRHPFEVKTLINDVKMLLETQAIIKNISIITAFNADPLFIYCEDTKIKQVLINIIKNAIEVMEYGTITIKTEEVQSRVILSIKDEGPGISKEELQKIGEPFYTTKPKGTGLGLLVCQKIIESHNGYLSIESKVGTGTTFIVDLPLHKTNEQI